MSGYALGLVQGILIAAFIALVLNLHLASTGSIWQLAGALGEANTRDVLKWARRRGLIYGWVDNLEIEGGDVDHLMAASGGWIAIDSKWHSRKLSESVLIRDAHSSRTAARRAALILQSEGLKTGVRAVVFLWGGTRDELTDRGPIDDKVEFVSGTNAKRWLRELPEGNYHIDEARQMLRMLEQFRARVRPEIDRLRHNAH